MAPRKPQTTDYHDSRPLSYRPPADLRAWLKAHAADTGQAFGAVITAALRDYRAKLEENGGGD